MHPQSLTFLALVAASSLAAQAPQAPANATTGPTPRSCATLSVAADSHGSPRVALYGGAAGPCGAPAVRDSALWLWNGATWDRVAAPGGPGAREDALMAFDPKSRATLLYGGRDGATVHEDTWQFRDGRWTRLSTAGGPGKLEHAAIAFDAERDRFVVFGGGSRDKPGAPSGDTWEWDGRTWTRMTAAAAPPARVGHTMTWSRAHGVLLYGGFAPAGSFRDLWRWNGSTWTRLDDRGPAETEGPAMVAIDAGVVVLGANRSAGAAPGVAAWLFDGRSWTQFASGGPPARIGQALALDADHRRVFVFGGADERDNRPSADLWELTISGASGVWRRAR